MQVPGVDGIVQGQRTDPVLQDPDTNLAKVVLAVLVLSPLGQFGLGLGGHVGEVVRGIKEESYRPQLQLLPDSGKESGAYLLDVIF